VNLKGATTRMGEMPTPAAGQATDATHRGSGRIESVGREEITISYGPIASLQWGPVTMGLDRQRQGCRDASHSAAMSILRSGKRTPGHFKSRRLHRSKQVPLHPSMPPPRAS